jgi:sortase (surface protein transpeptidase)
MTGDPSGSGPLRPVDPRRRPHRSPLVRAARVPLLLLVVALLSGIAGACSSDSDGGEDAAERTTTTAEASTTEATTSTTAPGSTVGTTPATIGPAPVVVEPTRLQLPSIEVDAEVNPVGVEPDGDMEVPSAEDAGWYRFGPTPGAAGSSVIAAHVDYNGEQGAFFRLREVEVGDPVEVSLSDGSTATWVVTRVDQLPKDDLRSSPVFDRAGTPRISLITCGGDFDESVRSYRDNVVVTAEPAP